MTQLAAICLSLIKGEAVSIMDGFKKFACTNLPRELSRGVEQKFGVKISKEKVDFTSTYGRKSYYYRYRLNKTDYNDDGIKKIIQYLDDNGVSIVNKTSKRIEPEHNSIF